MASLKRPPPPLKATSDIEVIEDSEPEREAQRRRIKELQKVDRASKKRAKLQPEVIVLTDSDADVRRPQRKSIINISDSSIIEVVPVLPPGPSEKPPPENSEEHYEEDTSSSFHFQQFAYKPTKVSLLSVPGPSFRASSATPSLAPPGSTTTATRRRSPYINSGYSFTSTQLNVLNKCPACNASWTTRKTAEAKLQHIRKCAKEQRLKDETIKILIQEILSQRLSEQNSDPKAPTSKGKGKAREIQALLVPPKPVTFLEKIVDDAAPKKRKGWRRKEVEMTVKPVSETGDSIRERAKALLEDDRRVLLPATQAFQPSRLGGAFAEHSTEPDSPPRDEAGPPSTQVFGISRLGNAYRNPVSLFGEAGEKEPGQNRTRVTDNRHRLSVENDLQIMSLHSPAVSPSKPSAIPMTPAPTSPSPRPRGRPRIHPISALSSTSPGPRARSRQSPILTPNITPSKPRGRPRLSPTTTLSLSAAERVRSPRVATTDAVEVNGGSVGCQSRDDAPMDWQTDDDDAILIWNDQSVAVVARSLSASGSSDVESSPQIRRQAKSPSTASSQNSVKKKTATTRNTPKTSRKTTIKTFTTAKPRGRPRKSASLSTPKTSNTGTRKAGTGSTAITATTIGPMEDQMKALILADTDLYARVLRYEPVSLAVFIQLGLRMRVEGINPKGLNTRLKNFLDQQCIVFYGATIAWK